jgi:hypothetical protein
MGSIDKGSSFDIDMGIGLSKLKKLSHPDKSPIAIDRAIKQGEVSQSNRALHHRCWRATSKET